MKVRNLIALKGTFSLRQGVALMAATLLLISSCQKHKAAPIPTLTIPAKSPFNLVQPPAPPSSSHHGPPYIGVLSGIVESKKALVVAGYQGTILRKSPNSAHWTRISVPAHSDFYGISRTPSGTLWVAGDRGVLMRSADSGRTWKTISTGIAPMFLNEVNFPSDHVGFAVGEKGVILKTSDGGDHWRKISSPTDENLYAVSFLDEKNGVIAGWHKTLLHTSDGGKKFVAIDIPMQKVTRQKPSFNSLWSGPGLVLLAGDHGLLFSSTDGGRSFSQIQTGTLNDLYGVCRTGSGTIAVSGEQGTLVLLNTDGKGNWKSTAPLGKFKGSDFLGITCGGRYIRVVGTKSTILLPAPSMH